MPLASANSSATFLTASILSASVQITRSASPRSGTAPEASEEGLSPPEVVVSLPLSPPPPHPAVSATASSAGTSVRAILRMWGASLGRGM